MPKSLTNIAKQVGVVASAIGAGVVAGLMLAPKSGKETRKDIKEKIEDTKEDISKKGHELKEKVKNN